MSFRWVDQKTYDAWVVDYEAFCEVCDVECPTFEAYLLMAIEGLTKGKDVFREKIQAHHDHSFEQSRRETTAEGIGYAQV